MGTTRLTHCTRPIDTMRSLIFPRKRDNNCIYSFKNVLIVTWISIELLTSHGCSNVVPVVVIFTVVM